MKTITIGYVFAADRRRAETRNAMHRLCMSAEGLALELYHQMAETFPVAETPGDAADELFKAGDDAVAAMFRLSDLFLRIHDAL